MRVERFDSCADGARVRNYRLEILYADDNMELFFHVKLAELQCVYGDCSV